MSHFSLVAPFQIIFYIFETAVRHFLVFYKTAIPIRLFYRRLRRHHKRRETEHCTEKSDKYVRRVKLLALMLFNLSAA